MIKPIFLFTVLLIVTLASGLQAAPFMPINLLLKHRIS
ncbi:hypothetical protein ERHA55_10010 [Erwinia rhapontici]|nr:hypothetical protein ERHA55_10010 [Erwinia rhapontici]